MPFAGLAHPDDASDLASYFARYTHTERLPVIARSALDESQRAALEAMLLGLPASTHSRLTEHLAEYAQQASRELLAEPDIADAMTRLPFGAGDRVVALGDSITDDACSWAEILRHALRSVPAGAEVINAGVTGHTTSDAIARIDLLTAQRPTWVIQLLGTNDARRHGRRAVRMVSIEETRRNLRALGEQVSNDLGARLIRMIPPPILEERVPGWVPFQQLGLSWHAADVDEIARAVLDLDPDAVDLYSALTPRAPQWLLPDGVHPSVSGQQQIARTLILHIAGRGGPDAAHATVRQGDWASRARGRW